SLYGEKVAIRLFAEQDQLQMLGQLGLPGMVEVGLRTHLEATSGVILLTGPSGSGKTTTAYACLREVRDRSSGTRCLMTLEDPIESAIAGVIQSQVKPAAGFSLTTGLRSLMRQDPDVILVGEIRDPETAEAAFQAALTGHLVVTTFHAGSAVEALTRLTEMQLEPYLIRSALRAVICQRLLRRSCVSCSLKSLESAKSRNPADKNSAHATLNAMCPVCSGTGYAGRLVLAELLEPEHPELVQGLLSRADARRMSALAEATGMVTLAQVAAQAVAEGQTTQEEVLRVLGGRRS
ncbi:MAG: Type traffic warden ATPase, partial [Planctomycetota bacterium]